MLGSSSLCLKLILILLKFQESTLPFNFVNYLAWGCVIGQKNGILDISIKIYFFCCKMVKLKLSSKKNTLLSVLVIYFYPFGTIQLTKDFIFAKSKSSKFILLKHSYSTRLKSITHAEIVSFRNNSQVVHRMGLSLSKHKTGRMLELLPKP